MQTKNKGLRKFLIYTFLILFGFVMVYPLIWLLMASVKENNSIFLSTKLIPETFDFSSYAKGWEGTGQYTFTTFFKNTFMLVIPTVVFTVISSVLVSYGFARFSFPGKKILFNMMLATLMLPNAVLIIPRYILFRNLGWLDSYLPFIMPALFACYPFFIYMLVQFFRGLPKELEEAATIDGCNSFKTLILILLPLCKPAIVSAAIFQFIWTWNDFFNPLIYINTVSKYPLSLAIRMSIDIASSSVSWNQVIAMSVLSITPCIILFFAAQKYFVEGIATSGLKG